MDRLGSGPVVLIGAGLVGASVGCALSVAGREVHIRDLVSSHARVAASRGAGTIAPVSAEEVELVVVAVPPRALAEVVAAALVEFPRAVVTDVGSVKAPVLAALASHPERSRYVGSHPMAGSHHAGPLTAEEDLFVDRTWVVCPHPDADPAAVETVRAMVRACRARLVELSAQEHDRAVARVSHLPHLASVLVAETLVDVPAEHLALAGQGLRDVTRIAGSDPGLWEQILAMNAATLSGGLQELRDRLDTMIAGLAAGTGVRDQLVEGVAGTRRIPGKHGRVATAWASVVVAIPDEPRALGRLFADIGDAGVNIEDIAIEHDPVRQVGYLQVSVDPDSRHALAALLDDAGWSVRG